MVKINRILCPVDFSPISQHAFDRAVALARVYRSEVTVLHVLPIGSAVPAVPYGPEGPGPFGFEVPERPRALTELSRFLGTEHPGDVPIHQEVIHAGAIHKEILDQASGLAADLIVMGTHGRSGVDHLFLGSVAEKTLRTSPILVMIVPPRAPDMERAASLRCILCAVDFSQDSTRALAYAASLAQHASARLTLMHVVEMPRGGYDPNVDIGFDMQEFQKAVVDWARIQLLKYARSVTAGTGEIDRVIGRGKAYMEILREAGERRVDLIVVGVHGRNALDRLVFGSTTEHLVRRARCPILTVPFKGAGVERQIPGSKLDPNAS